MGKKIIKKKQLTMEYSIDIHREEGKARLHTMFGIPTIEPHNGYNK